MCGRYALAVMVEDLQMLLPDFDIPADLAPRYNIAPTQQVPIAANDSRVVELARWGLIPSWAKDPAIGSRMINARAESLAEKPSFRDSFSKRRCLVLASGFYEWRKDEGSTRKTPFHVGVPGGAPFAFAGLWDTWRSPDGPVRSFTIVTTSASEAVAAIHDRMPVILPRTAHADWLDPAPRSPADLAPLLRPHAGPFEIREVSPLVNNPRNESPDCLLPA